MAGNHGGARPGAGRKPGSRNNSVNVRDAARGATEMNDSARQLIDLSATSQVTASAGKFRDAATRDAFVNYGHRLGVGAGNILSSSTSSFAPLTRIRVLLEWMYRGQFVCKNAVDVPADDMTRQGVSLKGSMTPANISVIESEATRMGIWNKLRETVSWSRLYGGCCAMLLIDGQRPETELRLDTVGPEQFQGLLTLDRWMIEPSLEVLVTDPRSPSLGLPMFYRVTADAPALPRMKIHHSRMIRLIGNKLPYWQAITENLWGLSVLETIQDRIQAFDLGSTGAAQLIDKSFIRTFKVEGLKELIGSNSAAYAGLQKYVEVMRAYQGIEGITLMDLKDEYEGHEHGSFSGLADIITEFRQQLSGALQIPQTKLFGTSPAGMNATGESDIRNYYDMIKGKQESELLVGTTVIYRLIAQSKGIKLPKDFGIEFKPLWQSTETEKAEVAGKITEAVLKAEEQGVISPKTALLELKQSSHQTGVFTNVTQEDINGAADEPIPEAEIGGEGGGPPKPVAKKPAPDGGKSKPKAKDGAPTDVRFGPANIYPPDSAPQALATPGADPTHDGQIGPITFEFHGLPICVETKRGETRMSRDPLNPWKATMQADYGYVVGTGSAEGEDEGQDVFVGPSAHSKQVWAINQAKDGAFEEIKWCLGFTSENEAIQAYLGSYDSVHGAAKRIMSVVECSIADMETFVFDSANNSKPYGV